MFFPKPKKINYNHYKENIKNPKSKLGLDKEIKFCKKCVISNQRPSSTIEFKNEKGEKKKVINFTDDDICSACIFNEEKEKNIDWKDRDKKLRNLLDKFKSNDGSYMPPSAYDISGASHWHNQSDVVITVHRDFDDNSTRITRNVAGRL